MDIRTRLAGAAGALAMLLVLAACNREAARPGAVGAASAPVNSKVVATVAGQPIYSSDVQLEAEAQGVTGQGKPLELDSGEFNRVLEQLIDVRLLAQEASGRGLDQDPQARHRLDAAREHILGNILVEQVVAERVDEAAIKKMYDAQVQIWEAGDEVHVRHIVLASKDEADKVSTELQKGADFAVLASQKSIDQATRLDGGDLGYIAEEDAPPELQKAIKSTPVGGVSKPFQTSMGWHVAKIEDRRKEQPPTLEELRDPILRHLTTVQIGEELKELRTKAKIEKFTKPSNAPIDTDPFTLAPVIPDAKPGVPLEASAARPPAPTPAADTRPPVNPPPPPPAPKAGAKTPEKASATPAKKPATPPAKTPAPAPAVVAPPVAAPAPAKPPASAAPANPTGPVGESRPIDTQ